MPSTTREIPKNEWRSYFDDLSRLPLPPPGVLQLRWTARRSALRSRPSKVRLPQDQLRQPRRRCR